MELRNITLSDLPVIFDHQLDPEANYIAAFTMANPADRDAFDAHWRRIMIDDTVTIRTILVDERVAGYVVSYVLDNKPEVGYWIGREFWGQGVATRAMRICALRHRERLCLRT